MHHENHRGYCSEEHGGGQGIKSGRSEGCSRKVTRGDLSELTPGGQNGTAEEKAFLQEKEQNLDGPEYGHDFSYTMPKAQSMKEIIDSLNVIKLKTSTLQKTMSIE